MIGTRVKELRTFMTDAKRKLWHALRSRGVGAKFRRQVPLGPYIADFVSFDAKMIVEVDGGQHASSVTDQERDRYFVNRGYRILRFWNNDVLSNPDGVLQTISAAIHPSPGAPLRGAPPSPSRTRVYPSSAIHKVAEIGNIRLPLGEGKEQA
jgi:very-short-patch-repair endonuclease